MLALFSWPATIDMHQLLKAAGRRRSAHSARSRCRLLPFSFHCTCTLTHSFLLPRPIALLFLLRAMSVPPPACKVWTRLAGGVGFPQLQQALVPPLNSAVDDGAIQSAISGSATFRRPSSTQKVRPEGGQGPRSGCPTVQRCRRNRTDGGGKVLEAPHSAASALSGSRRSHRILPARFVSRQRGQWVVALEGTRRSPRRSPCSAPMKMQLQAPASGQAASLCPSRSPQRRRHIRRLHLAAAAGANGTASSGSQPGKNKVLVVGGGWAGEFAVPLLRLAWRTRNCPQQPAQLEHACADSLCPAISGSWSAARQLLV